MALQFPADPQNGAEYTDPSNGVTYYYNENKNTWTAAGAGSGNNIGSGIETHIEGLN